ncbi:response regulator [Balneatrix alpica]|uniref:Response regulator n=1 Tax=Balneatrix alpica TaxID=75684 RepID=A0ABV5Z780_9GAMM|nr:response regulator [Balneatrix alpica]
MQHAKRCALIVDDDPINVEILTDYLSSTGFTILTAYDGRQALELLQQQANHIDVVLLDRMMPHVDGLTVLKEIRNQPALQHLLVIMQTAKARPQEIEEGQQAGADYYLTKPFEEDDLLAILDKLLPGGVRFE